MSDDDVVIVGGGIAGLTLALGLERRGIPCRVYESVSRLKPLGVGISLLPHGTKVLAELGLLDQLKERAVIFRESCFFNSAGQLVHRDPAPDGWPQFLIHRGVLHEILMEAVTERLGADAVALGHTCVGVDQDGESATARFVDSVSGRSLEPQVGRAVAACDGIHSAVRAQFYPGEGEPVFSGTNMWRGINVCPPILSGGSHIRVGTVARGKLVVYPIRDDVDGQGNQLVNWVAEIRQPQRGPVDWNAQGRVEDFLPTYADWRFDWLDVPELLTGADMILEYPMSDRDPVERWAFDRIALVGDAAHPMIPRGSNGAMQAIRDTAVLADAFAQEPGVVAALRRYEDERLEAANTVVLTNRVTPPDHLIEEVERRTNYQRFDKIEDVISPEEVRAILDHYKTVAGYSAAALAGSAKPLG